jgi:hypothetical protein
VTPVVAANLSAVRLLEPRDYLRPDGGLDVPAPDGASRRSGHVCCWITPSTCRPSDQRRPCRPRRWPLYPLGAGALARALLRHARPARVASRNWPRLLTLNAFAAGCFVGLSASVILETSDPIHYNSSSSRSEAAAGASSRASASRPRRACAGEGRRGTRRRDRAPRARAAGGSGNVLRSARRRVKARTVVVRAAACSAASSFSAGLAANSSNSSASRSISRAERSDRCPKA